MIEFGTEKTISTSEGFSVININKIKRGEPYATLRQYRIRISVNSSHEEMTEFIKFTEEIKTQRESKKLHIDKYDPSTFPAFIIEYPKNDLGTYFIVKCYTIVIWSCLC